MRDEEVLRIVRENQWYIIKSLEFKLDDLARSIRDSEVALKSNGFPEDVRESMQNIISYCRRTHKNYSGALSDLKKAGLS